MDDDFLTSICTSSLSPIGRFAAICRQVAGPVKIISRNETNPLPFTCKSDDTSIQALEVWLQSHNVAIGQAHPIRIVKDRYGGLGVVACDEISTGTLLMKVRSDAHLSKEQSLASEIGSFVKIGLQNIQLELRGTEDLKLERSSETERQCPPFDVDLPYRSPGEPAVALYLLHEASKGERSRLHPYINALPSPSAAWTLNPTAISVLPSNLAPHAARLSRLIDAEYDALARLDAALLAFPRGALSRRRYRWAQSLILSRAFAPEVAPGGGGGGGSPCKVLVPGVDLVNHAGDALFGPFWDDSDGAAELYAARP